MLPMGTITYQLHYPQDKQDTDHLFINKILFIMTIAHLYPGSVHSEDAGGLDG